MEESGKEEVLSTLEVPTVQTKPTLEDEFRLYREQHASELSKRDFEISKLQSKLRLAEVTQKNLIDTVEEMSRIEEPEIQRTEMPSPIKTPQFRGQPVRGALNATIANIPIHRLPITTDVAGDTTMFKAVGSQPLVGAETAKVIAAGTKVLQDYALHKITPSELTGVVRIDEHGLVEDERALKAAFAICELFGATIPAERSRVTSAVCWFFAQNSTSWLVPRELSVAVVLGERAESRTLGQIRDILFSVTGESSMRRIMRAFADFTRSVIALNTSLIPKAYARLNLPEQMRSIAFDFSEFCRNPPLNRNEMLVAQRVKRFLLSKLVKERELKVEEVTAVMPSSDVQE